ncbi:MAG: transporter [Tunicatimonas sp.]
MRPCTINAKLIASLIFVGALATSFAYAQPITDGFMKGKGNGSLVVSYSWERYDEFYAGSTLREGIDTGLRTWGGEITTQSVSLYGTIGLTDNVDIIVNVPYITVQGAGVDTVSQEDSGLQDASLFVKWRPLLIETGGGNLSFLGALGFATPLSDYEEDLPLSIGNQSTRADLRLITHFQSNAGLFGELQAGYSLRTNNVPNATLLSAKIGYAASAFYVDLWSETQISDSDAIDIGGGPFNETRVNYTQIGASLFVPVASGFGVSAGVGRYVSGRNVGLGTRFSGGVVYSF